MSALSQVRLMLGVIDSALQNSKWFLKPCRATGATFCQLLQKSSVVKRDKNRPLSKSTVYATS